MELKIAGKIESIDKIPYTTFNQNQINSIKSKYPDLRQASKGPTFSQTYAGTYHTLMKNFGFDKVTALKIEASYHELYKVSDQWVDKKLEQAAIDGYVTGAFGLRLRTPLLTQSLRNHESTPKETLAEGRTAGNMLGQSYCLLNNRALNEFMQKVWYSDYRLDIKPVAMIHDSIYLVVRNDINVMEWANNTLIASMKWQELPELQHPTVKLGAELDIYYPSWDKKIIIPNNASQEEILMLCKEYKK